MGLATPEDVESALRRTLTDEELSSVEGLIEEASDLVLGYLCHYVLPDPVDPVPAPIVRAVATMVAAVLTKPVTTAADYGTSGYNIARESMTVAVGVESATTTGPWLTSSLKQRLDPYRVSFWSYSM